MNYTYNYGTHSGYIPGSIASKRLLEKIHLEQISNFVETGTYMGDGIYWALDENGKFFHTITSIEYAAGLADRAQKLFSQTCIPEKHGIGKT